MRRVRVWTVTIVCLCLLAALSHTSPGHSNPAVALPFEMLAPTSRPASPSAAAIGADSWPDSAVRVELHVGSEFAPVVLRRIEGHLASVPGATVTVCRDPCPSGSEADLVLALGDVAAARAVISDAEVVGLGREGFVLRSAGSGTLAARGGSAQGSAYAAYAVLEALGFAFLHPLEPTLPASLRPTVPQLDERQTPRWDVRGLHLHTMHPTELTELLQGWGPDGPGDVNGWSGELPRWDSFLEWMLANRQNRVQWVLLEAEPWSSFSTSKLRQERLASLVARGHEFLMEVGVDVPIALHQQHAWRLVEPTGRLEQELGQIRHRLDYLMGAGFDYVATESGSTEFTAPDATQMLAWMNEFAQYLDEAYGKSAVIKIHASSGQRAEKYGDPVTGGALNFNFLPHHADRRLGVLPHTVQHYGLDDPAPTYGNENFEAMRRFVHSQVGRRQVLWHPESSYWVSFDIDVPLFLPIYAERRLHDLRLLATDEEQGTMANAGRMDGQLTFSSGWEWSYWLGEVVAARAAWDPHLELDDAQALRRALGPIVRPFGEYATRVRTLIEDTIAAQHALLIEGRVGASPPEDVVARNGQAYLQGFDALDDISEVARHLPGVELTMTQPERLGLVELRNPWHGGPDYAREVEPLLAAMDTRFAALALEFEKLRPHIPPHARAVYDDMADAARMTSLRATQVHALYDYVDGYWGGDEAWRTRRLDVARLAVAAARTVVARRERGYRIDPGRLAGWGRNSTAYGYGYLWTVRSLYYWVRDERQATGESWGSCALNIVSPVAAGLGESQTSRALDEVATALGDVPAVGGLAQCLGAPVVAPL